MPGIEPRSTVGKANALPTSHQFDPDDDIILSYNYLQEILLFILIPFIDPQLSHSTWDFLMDDVTF